MKTKKPNSVKKPPANKKNIKFMYSDSNMVHSASIDKYYNLLFDKENIKNKETFIVDKSKENQKLKPLIEIKDLKKVYKKGFKKHIKVVLNGINLNINEGENLAILGANGAGKTTLVETIMGLVKPTSGKIIYHLTNSRKPPFDQLGIQFQSSSYPEALATHEVIRFILNIYKCKISNDQLSKVIKIFGIDEFLKSQIKSLSGGELQRINCLFAIMHRPRVIFLDEISTGLDLVVKNHIKNFIYEFAKENNMTIVIISHDISEIEFLTERIIILDQGNIIVDNYLKNIKKIDNDLEQFIKKYI